jgi:tetratricopeptide (TPR) repeat protein
MKTKAKNGLTETKLDETSNMPPDVSRFSRHLRISMEHYTEAEWLGENSPLATPYFLGTVHKDSESLHSTNAIARGHALQALLRKSVESLAYKGKEGAYSQRILDLRFIHPHTQDYVYEALNISRATYYRHEARALDLLEAALLQIAQPALRQETPLVPAILIARDDLIAETLSHLHEKKTVALLGGVGLGKTTLGSAIASHWSAGPVFWYTFRQGLNDQITSLLFSLGHFLNLAGASGLWLQLISDHGRTALPLVEGLLRHDLEIFGDQPPLFCFDEVDVLRPEELEAHAQLIALLASLYRQVPAILIGQATRPQRLLQVDVEYLLDPLKVEDVGLLLQKLEVTATPAEVQHLAAYTHGNLRLLHLCAAAWRQDSSLHGLIASLPETPQVETIILRLYQKLREGERQLLKRLCIFDHPSPSDVWDEDMLWRMQTSGLARLTRSNTVEVLAAAVPIIRSLLTDDERKACHNLAGQILEGRGLFTAAAHHYIRAGFADAAVALWVRHKQAEVDQGMSRQALSMFEPLIEAVAGAPAQPEIQVTTREQLILVCSELQMLMGALDKASKSLTTAIWQSNSPLQAEAQILRAEVGLAQNSNVAVQHELEDGVAQMLSIVEGLPFMHLRMSDALYYTGDLAEALRRTRVAECEVRLSQGTLHVLLGDYSSARKCFDQALELAEALGEKRTVARAQLDYADLLATTQQKSEAIPRLRDALDYYQQVGDIRLVAETQCNMAGIHLALHQFLECINLANQSLKVFETLDIPKGIFRAAYFLTLASLESGDIERAQTFLKIAHSKDIKLYQPYQDYLKCRVIFQQGKVTDALTRVQQCIGNAQEARNKPVEAYSLQLLGQIYQSSNDLLKARQAFHSSIEIFTELNMLDEAEDARQFLQTCC